MNHKLKSSVKLFFLFAISSSTLSLHAQKLKDRVNEMKQRENDKIQFGGKESTLKDKDIKTIAMSASENPSLAPGGYIEIGMTATLTDGTEMKTTGFAQGKTQWGNYKVTVTGGTFSDGTISIYSDLKNIPGNLITVTCALFKDSTQFKTMSWKLNFKANYYAHFDGLNGAEGQKGYDGQHGSNGANDRTGTGEAGGNGERGGDGGSGGNGQPGESVDVFVTAFKDENGITLLKVYCKSKSSDKEAFFIVNPDGGSVTISAQGGSGGSGGHGGDGGGGGNGGDGHCQCGSTTEGHYGGGGKGGSGGNGGNGGNGGDGGNGGNITIYLDPSATAYANVIKADTEGGSAGGVGFPGSGRGPGSSGTGDNNGGQGTSGNSGNYGHGGNRSGMSGPKPTILNQKVTIDWDKVQSGN